MEALKRSFDEAFEAPSGVKQLRKLILTLAMRGELVTQDPDDPPIREAILKDLTLKIGSGSTPTGGKESYLSSGIPLIRSMNVHFGRFKMDGLAFIDDKQAEKLNNVIVQERDVLLNITGASIGRVTIAPPQMANARVNQHVCIIRPNSSVDPHYLEAFLASPLIQRMIDECQVGATRGALTKAMIEQFRITVPSLNTQHRVVARLKELMTRCDELEKLHTERDSQRLELHAAAIRKLLGVSNEASDLEARAFLSQHFGELYTVKENVVELRKAILQLAVMGRLSSQDPKDPPAHQLISKIRSEKKQLVMEGKLKKPKQVPPVAPAEIPFALPKGWEWTRFGTLATEIATGPFGSMIHQSDYIEGGVPLINPSHMIAGKVVFDPNVSIPQWKAEEMKSYSLSWSDIVMARRGEMGRCAIVTEKEEGFLCGTGSFILRFVPEVDREYIWYTFQTAYAREYLGGRSVGITMTNLNHDILNAMPIFVPPVPEQRRIVIKIESLMSMCDDLEKRIEAARYTQTCLLDSVMAQFEDRKCA